MKLTPTAKQILQQLSQDASDALGWTVTLPVCRLRGDVLLSTDNNLLGLFYDLPSHPNGSLGLHPSFSYVLADFFPFHRNLHTLGCEIILYLRLKSPLSSHNIKKIFECSTYFR